jgi:PHP family Zn ribbon phosphoesterase
MSAVTEKKVHVQDLHFENELWLNELEFVKQELALFENKLPHLLIANAGNAERIAKIEQFQNQFIRQKEALDELKHDVHVSEQQLAGKVKEMNSVEIQHKTVSDHASLRQKVDNYKTIYGNFKRKFFDFIIHRQ